MQGDSELGRAHRIQNSAADVGFDWPDAKGPMLKVREELEELEVETGRGSRDELEAELGDLLFAVVNLARKLNIDSATALARANDKFVRRFGMMEQLAEARGIQLGRARLEELDELWEAVKAGEGR
jgi:uncharacterized protein YabN with tetrapyrrole methylase and pyrophosphatase domain